MVARGGIEPPTRGFSVRYRPVSGFTNQSLTALAIPHSRLTTAQLRHTQSELDTVLGQRRVATLRACLVLGPEDALSWSRNSGHDGRRRLLARFRRKVFRC